MEFVIGALCTVFVVSFMLTFGIYMLGWWADSQGATTKFVEARCLGLVEWEITLDEGQGEFVTYRGYRLWRTHPGGEWVPPWRRTRLTKLRNQLEINTRNRVNGYQLPDERFHDSVREESRKLQAN